MYMKSGLNSKTAFRTTPHRDTAG